MASPRPVGGDTPAISVTIALGGTRVTVEHVSGEVLLESARRGGLAPPFSCESGSCGTCMALVAEGHAVMAVNDVLDDDEVADGYVLTCQAIPDTAEITVDYDA